MNSLAFDAAGTFFFRCIIRGRVRLIASDFLIRHDIFPAGRMKSANPSRRRTVRFHADERSRKDLHIHAVRRVGVVPRQHLWHALVMTHASTENAKRREADRLRKAAERAERKAIGAPTTGQIDMAISEALAFLFSSSLAKTKPGLVPNIQLQVRSVVRLACRILIIRWRLNPDACSKALAARIAKRPEHCNPTWFPHHSWCEPNYWLDLSNAESANTPVTSSGLVRAGGEEVTEI